MLGFDYVVPFRWKAGQGVLQLGQAAGTYPYLEQTYAYATSEDGNVVAGSTFNWLGPGPNFRATIWTPATGNVLLESYLWFLGVQELDPAYRLEAATDVSADGTKVIGRGLTPLFGHFWWEATLPICNGGTAGFCVTSPNSVGSGARIGSNGHVFIPFNSFELSVTGMPAHARGFFLYGPQAQQVPFGNGFSCVAPGGVGTFRLLPPFQSDAGGNAVRTLDFSQLAGAGQIVPGSTWYFQAWYRDPAAGGAGFNLSDGLEADFCD